MMASFIINTSELVKYPALENDLSDLCAEIVKTDNHIILVPKPGSIATVGMVLFHNHISCKLELDALEQQELKEMPASPGLREIVRKNLEALKVRIKWEEFIGV